MGCNVGEKSFNGSEILERVNPWVVITEIEFNLEINVSTVSATAELHHKVLLEQGS